MAMTDELLGVVSPSTTEEPFESHVARRKLFYTSDGGELHVQKEATWCAVHSFDLFAEDVLKLVSWILSFLRAPVRYSGEKASARSANQFFCF